MDQLARLTKIMDKSTIDVIKKTSVLVVGLGGVGSYAVEALARCGIGELILVDYDIVEITNLNRQLVALHSTIGMKKIDVMHHRIMDVNPNCKVKTLDVFLNESTKDDIFKYQFDYLIDACDTIATKKLIIKECLSRRIKFITCMGTGNRFDPSKLAIMDIRKTSYDPISKYLRKMIKDERIKEKIPVVSSVEIPKKTHEYTPGSNSFVPASAGLLCASYVINDIKR